MKSEASHSKGNETKRNEKSPYKRGIFLVLIGCLCIGNLAKLPFRQSSIQALSWPDIIKIPSTTMKEL